MIHSIFGNRIQKQNPPTPHENKTHPQKLYTGTKTFVNNRIKLFQLLNKLPLTNLWKLSIYLSISVSSYLFEYSNYEKNSWANKYFSYMNPFIRVRFYILCLVVDIASHFVYTSIAISKLSHSIFTSKATFLHWNVSVNIMLLNGFCIVQFWHILFL